MCLLWSGGSRVLFLYVDVGHGGGGGVFCPIYSKGTIFTIG